jgi:hypothetical protein
LLMFTQRSDTWGILEAIVMLIMGSRFIIDCFTSDTFTLIGRGRRDPDGPKAHWYHRVLMLAFGITAVVFGIVQLMRETGSH